MATLLGLAAWLALSLLPPAKTDALLGVSLFQWGGVGVIITAVWTVQSLNLGELAVLHYNTKGL